MPTRDIVVVGASAGGIDALTRVLAQLPANFPAAILVTLHVSPLGVSLLPKVLARAGKLPVTHAQNGETMERGKVLVAPPDQHMIVENSHVHLTRGPKENHSRPSINPMFRSASIIYGPRVIGVLLSGALDDGVSGLWEIKRRGGLTVVQSPDDARHPNMPRNAANNVEVDHVGTAEEIGILLRGLTREQVTGIAPENNALLGIPTEISCPECRGALDLYVEGDLVEYRCRVKHTYSPEAMIAAHSETEERTLWSAVVTLEEGADVAEKLAPKLPEDVRPNAEKNINRNREAARQIRCIIERMNGK
jgi:two-component system chemotaxis response regulator CheB